jgi:MFS family permease
VSHLRNNRTSLTASLVLTGLASTGTSVIWNGLPFIAKRDFRFSESENLSLYLLIGFVYVLGALTSGWCTGKLKSFISIRSIIALLLGTVAIACSLPLFEQGSSWVIWTAGGVAGFCSSWLWPIVESYLVVGRHGKEMRRAIGWWNLVWMLSVAGSMLAMAPMMEEHASMVIVGLGVMNLAAIGVLPWYAKNPPKHDEGIAIEHVPKGYRGLLNGARILLPLSYVMNGLLAPLLPFVLAGIAIDIFWQTPVASIWMFSRVLITALMWRIPFGPATKFGGWHGRWSVLWGALFALALGFICILSANSLAMLIGGLVLFGGGMGVTYYAALYYAMAVGQAKVDAGGKHEAFIGGGYVIGPIVGLASIEPTSTSFAPIIYVVLAILTLATMMLAVFWRKAR